MRRTFHVIAALAFALAPACAFLPGPARPAPTITVGVPMTATVGGLGVPVQRTAVVSLAPDVRCCADCGSVCPCRLLDGCKCPRP